MQYPYRDFFPLYQTVFELVDFDAFQCFCLFCLFVSPRLQWQNICLWGVFSSGETKKKRCLEWDQVNREGGRQGQAVFGQKLLNTQHGVGTCKSPIMKWANALKESLKKNSLKLNTASHNNASWFTDTDGFLEHSPKQGKPILQRACPP